MDLPELLLSELAGLSGIKDIKLVLGAHVVEEKEVVEVRDRAGGELDCCLILGVEVLGVERATIVGYIS